MLGDDLRQPPLDADQRRRHAQGLDLAGPARAGRRVEPPCDLVEVPAIAGHSQNERGIDMRCGLAPSRLSAPKRLTQKRGGRQARCFGLESKRGLLLRRAAENEGFRARLLGTGRISCRWGSKGRLAAPRKAPCQKRQRMTWVALLSA